MLRKLFSVAAMVALVGCATYRDDLDRSMVHYHANNYDKALALLEVVEPDLDSLSPSERAQYAYYRGMSHFRLEQRRDARHWLGRSAAREKADEGSLSSEELKRVNDTLTDLNKDRWGGASTEAAETKTCAADTDCEGGQFCDGGVCKKAEKAAAEPAAAPATDPAPAPDKPAPDKPAPDKAQDNPTEP